MESNSMLLHEEQFLAWWEKQLMVTLAESTSTCVVPVLQFVNLYPVCLQVIWQSTNVPICFWCILKEVSDSYFSCSTFIARVLHLQSLCVVLSIPKLTVTKPMTVPWFESAIFSLVAFLQLKKEKFQCLLSHMGICTQLGLELSISLLKCCSILVPSSLVISLPGVGQYRAVHFFVHHCDPVPRATILWYDISSFFCPVTLCTGPSNWPVLVPSIPWKARVAFSYIHTHAHRTPRRSAHCRQLWPHRFLSLLYLHRLLWAGRRATVPEICPFSEIGSTSRYADCTTN